MGICPTSNISDRRATNSSTSSSSSSSSSGSSSSCSSSSVVVVVVVVVEVATVAAAATITSHQTSSYLPDHEKSSYLNQYQIILISDTYRGSYLPMCFLMTVYKCYYYYCDCTGQKSELSTMCRLMLLRAEDNDMMSRRSSRAC